MEELSYAIYLLKRRQSNWSKIFNIFPEKLDFPRTYMNLASERNCKRREYVLCFLYKKYVQNKQQKKSIREIWYKCTIYISWYAGFSIKVYYFVIYLNVIGKELEQQLCYLFFFSFQIKYSYIVWKSHSMVTWRNSLKSIIENVKMSEIYVDSPL